MERLRIIVCILCGCLLSTAGFGALMTEISYEVTEAGWGQWQYTYEVTNINLLTNGVPSPIEEFTIWFDEGLYDNLMVMTYTLQAGQWDQIVWQPEPIVGAPGAFDALSVGSNTSIVAGESVFGFMVVFDWLGTGEPGRQYYEIINPDTFETIDSGYTIPEPATMALLSLGGLLIRRRK